MSRIAKADVNAALTKAAQNIRDAAGRDGVTSRADMKAKLATLSGTEKRLTDMFFRFLDHRDYKTNARITDADVTRGLDYAKEHLLEKYDLAPQNGYSKAEIAKMSVTGQLAVKLAAEIKGVKLPDPAAPTSDLGKAINEAAKGADYMSESDSTPTYVESGRIGANDAITGQLVFDRFANVLKKAFDYDNTGVDLSKYAFEVEKPADAAKFLADQAVPGDPNDQFDVDNAKAWGKLKTVFEANISDVTLVRVGPRDEQDASKMGTDQGAYEYLLVGRTKDGKLAGVTFESVET